MYPLKKYFIVLKLSALKYARNSDDFGILEFLVARTYVHIYVSSNKEILADLNSHR